MESKIYLMMNDFDYEGHEIVGIFPTKELAISFMESKGNTLEAPIINSAPNHYYVGYICDWNLQTQEWGKDRISFYWKRT